MKKLNLLLIIIAVLLSVISLNAQEYCLNFDGVDDYVEVPYSTLLNSNEFTVSCWGKLEGGSGTFRSPITSRGVGMGFAFYATTDDKWDCMLGIGSENGYWVSFDSLATDVIYDSWTHLTATYDGSLFKFYVNGISLGEIDTKYVPNDIYNLRIGAGTTETTSNYSFDGKIDEVRIWNIARTETEINENMHISLEGTETGLVAYYEFDEGSGIALTDGAGSNDGILMNMKEADWVLSTCFNPQIKNLSPQDNAIEIVLNTNLEITFDMNVIAGSGNVVIYKSSDDSVVETILSSSCVIMDSLVTINPSDDFELQTDYYILIDSTAFMNNDSLYFGGISDKAEWDFRSQNYFTDINAGLIGVYASSVAWGDYDNDGDLDIILTGDSGNDNPTCIIYNNDSGGFAAQITPLGVRNGSVVWGDYDNDGNLEFLLTGDSGNDNSICMICRFNNDEGFNIEYIFRDLKYGSGDWGDYDNDGDLDIVLAGDTGSERISEIYRNDGDETFTNINAELPGVVGSIAWFDSYFGLEILLTGDTGSERISRVYYGSMGGYTSYTHLLPGVASGSFASGDYDNDGDLDILLTGISIFGTTSKIYNNFGPFLEIGAGLTGVTNSSVAWGDYDNDGDLDILLTGYTGSESISKIYRNDSGVFTDINAGLQGVSSSSVAWGDYDNDGDLDILLTGRDNSNNPISKIYCNNSIIKNTIPSKPSGLITELENNDLTLLFDFATDNETPQNGLSYNIDISVNGLVLKSGMSDVATGYRKVVDTGNTIRRNSYNIPGFYYYLPQEENKNVSWKVQAIDHCFAGSEFSASADTSFISRDLEFITYDEMEPTDLLTWEYTSVNSILNYQLQLDDDVNFGSPLEEIIPLTKKDTKIIYHSIALNELINFDSLLNNTTYFWRVKPNYEFTTSRYNDTLLSFIYNPTYSAPSPVNIAITGDFVTLSWNTTKDTEKGEVYNVYSTDDPYAVFPAGWDLEIEAFTATTFIIQSTELKKFYCVTSTSGKEEDVETPIHRVSK